MPRATPLLLLALLAACGARTGLVAPERDGEAPTADAAPDVACEPVADNCGAQETCGNGADDDCDGRVDEGCACEPGTVQPCFAGPPGRRNVGACRDGAQTCGAEGAWGECSGGIAPRADVCNGADNLCTGCSRQRDCPIACPSPGDARVPDGAPFRAYPLRGREFYPMGEVRSWQWFVQGGPCDAVSARASFELRDARAANATLVPRLSGDYTVNLRVTTASGRELACAWVVHVAGPGLRVEMCYPESLSQDLDLFLHRPDDRTPWYRAGATSANAPTTAACGWHNCEAHVRDDASGRVDWGYARSPIAECENGPFGNEWRLMLGACGNPRLDLDNNLREGAGVPENINLDNPRDGQSFRVMVQNWTGLRARPVVNVYCGGRRRATFGARPDELRDFFGEPGDRAFGAMWRVADVTTRVDAATGRTTGCDVRALHPPGQSRGYYVTRDDPSY